MIPSFIVILEKPLARFFSVENTPETPRLETRLVQKGEMKNDRLELLESAQKIDTRRGDYATTGPKSTPGAVGHQASNSGSGFAVRSAFTDADQAEEANVMRLFVRDIGVEIMNRAHSIGASQIVVVAGPKLLGHVRHEFPKALSQQFSVVEVEKGLGNLSNQDIHDALVREGVIPTRHVDPDFRAAGQTLSY
jgi:protein required for attachment to host cells